MSTEIRGTSSEATKNIEDLIGRVRAGWIPFRRAVDLLAASDFERATPAGWTYKQMLAHIAAWHEVTARRMVRFRDTGAQQPPVGDVNAFNAEVAGEARGAAVDEVLRRLDGSHAALADALAPLDDAALQAFDGWAVAVVAGNSFGHYTEHIEELLTPVRKSRDALLASFDVGWTAFRGLVRAADLERRTSAGWSGKALVAHVAWSMTTVPAALELGMMGRRGSLMNADEENARIAAAAERLTPRQVILKLDTAYDLVRQALVALAPAAEVPSAAVELVATGTYDRFSRHAGELLEILA